MDWEKYYKDTQKFIEKCEEIGRKFDKSGVLGYHSHFVEHWVIEKDIVYGFNDDYEQIFEFDAKFLGFSSEEIDKYIEEIKNKKEKEKEENLKKRKEDLLKLSKEELVDKVLHPFK